ncbi:cyclase family protein [Streptomyces viridochromogenes]|uniref:cyclase family protein n=1 Tax=Streptomyces viridochromogenes TaxID=1938 RepID=UPI00069D01F3|nr:cyclase family protein [Streptomyces viridochromogenes]
MPDTDDHHPAVNNSAFRGFPSYAELRSRTDAPAGSAWGVFGSDDELGTLNHLTPERVRAAAGLVRTGEVITLDHPLDAFTPPLVPTRKPVRHTLFANNPCHRDEYLDSFYTQSSSQLDGFRHIGHPEAGFYNGADPARFVEGEPFLGINRFTEHGIVGRGVLIDVDRYLKDRGSPIDHAAGEAIPITAVAEATRAQGTELRVGDILMIRTGWAHYHLHQRSLEERRSAGPIRASGLEAGHDTVEWLWDNRFSVVATDNFAVEAWPAPPTSPFVTDSERRGDIARDGHTGLMHRVLIPLLGMVLGELWDLDALATRCAADGRWDCMVVCAPLHLTGGAGSPSNTVAIR